MAARSTRRKSGALSQAELSIPKIPDSVLEKVPAPLHKSYQLWWRGLWRREVPLKEAEELAANAEMQARFYSAYVTERRKKGSTSR